MKAYIPQQSEWYRMDNYFVEKVNLTSGQHIVTFSDEESDRPLLFRAGSIIPVVDEHNLPEVINTHNLRQVPIDLWVLPNSNGKAFGDLFFDDGESINTIESGEYLYYEFHLNKCRLTFDAVHQPRHSYLAMNSEDILKLSAINVALFETSNINSDEIKVSLVSENNMTTIGKTDIKIDKNSLKINLEEPLDLLKINLKVEIDFSYKNNGKCFY